MSMFSESGSRRSLSAMFDTRAEADRAVAALEAAGIADVVLTGGDNPGYGATVRDVRGDMTEREKGFFEQLGDFFFPDEDRYAYAEGLERGGYLVTIDNIPEDRYAQALDILDDEGAVDLDAREDEWRAEGWSYDRGTGYDSEYGASREDLAYSASYNPRDEHSMGRMVSRPAEDSLAATRDEGLPGTVASRAADRVGEALSGERRLDERDLNRDGTIDIAEERLYISKRERDLGRVRVRSYVRETPVEETVNLREEHVSIERRPVDRAATDADFRDQSIEAREYAEEAVVNKEARVVEEVAIRTDETSHDETVRDSVRRTEVEIEDERGDSLKGDSLKGDDRR